MNVDFVFLQRIVAVGNNDRVSDVFVLQSDHVKFGTFLILTPNSVDTFLSRVSGFLCGF